MAVCDLPARALLDAAGGAGLLVLGPRGLGGFQELVLGSVSVACLHHATCPVAIVRSDVTVPPAATRDGERIVAAIDGSEPSVRALRWAIYEARARGATVEAVHAWHVPYDVAFAVAAAPAEMFEDAGRQVLDEIVNAAAPATADVPVESILVRGSTGDVVLGAAKGADLLYYRRHLFLERHVRSVTANTRADGEEFLALAARLRLNVTTTPYTWPPTGPPGSRCSSRDRLAHRPASPLARM